MRTNIKTFIFSFSFLCRGAGLLIAFSSCSSNNAEDERQAMIVHIDSINKIMFDETSAELNKDLVQQGITAYSNFVKKYSNDSLSPEYLFRLADLQKAVGDNGKAIESLSEICKKYPEYKKIPECIFLQGYYYQEYFNDTVSAKGFYQELISKYPNHAFADDAQALMRMFGKSDDEIIRSFEKKKKK